MVGHLGQSECTGVCARPRSRLARCVGLGWGLSDVPAQSAGPGHVLAAGGF